MSDKTSANDAQLYWVWLSLCFSTGSVKPARIAGDFDDLRDFYALSAEQLKDYSYLTEKDINTIKTVSLDRARLVQKDCERCHISIVTFDDELYPDRFRVIYGPPVVLYVMGDISGIDEEVAITVVGTRLSSDYTAYATEYLSYHLAKAGCVIVSGCAVGIDAAAHRGALKAGGRTIGILGCGLDVNYPVNNHDLKQAMIQPRENGPSGALISELPPGVNTSPHIYQYRNRLLAGLSLGVLVTHAPERSGALITAEHAIEQGKDLFCLPPCNIFDSQYFGVIRYIRDGAIPVFNPRDILMEYSSSYAHKLNADKIIGNYVNRHGEEVNKLARKPERRVQPEPENEEIMSVNIEDFRKKHTDLIKDFTTEQLSVYNVLTLTPSFIDEIAAECDMDVGTVLSILTELEIFGVAGSFSGRRYALMK